MKAARVVRAGGRWKRTRNSGHLASGRPVPRFYAPPGTVIAAPGTAELITRMQHAELAARAHMPRPPRTPRTTSRPTQGNDNA